MKLDGSNVIISSNLYSNFKKLFKEINKVKIILNCDELNQHLIQITGSKCKLN